jgi:hypothetical protein
VRAARETRPHPPQVSRAVAASPRRPHLLPGVHRERQARSRRRTRRGATVGVGREAVQGAIGSTRRVSTAISHLLDGGTGNDFVRRGVFVRRAPLGRAPLGISSPRPTPRRSRARASICLRRKSRCSRVMAPTVGAGSQAVQDTNESTPDGLTCDWLRRRSPNRHGIDPIVSYRARRGQDTLPCDGGGTACLSLHPSLRSRFACRARR